MTSYTSGLRDNDLLSNFDFHSHDGSEFGSLCSKNETTSRETDKQKRKVIRPPKKAS